MVIVPDMIEEMYSGRFLVEYKGGGYDGCLWQWNYFAFVDGDFYNIFSSGYKGIKSVDRALAFLEETRGRRADMSVCDLADEESIILFVGSGNASNMIATAHHFYNILPEIEIVGQCYECERVLPVVEMDSDNWSGDGGIAYSAKNLICCDCTEEDYGDYWE